MQKCCMRLIMNKKPWSCWMSIGMTCQICLEFSQVLHNTFCCEHTSMQRDPWLSDLTFSCVADIKIFCTLLCHHIWHSKKMVLTQVGIESNQKTTRCQGGLTRTHYGYFVFKKTFAWESCGTSSNNGALWCSQMITLLKSFRSFIHWHSLHR